MTTDNDAYRELLANRGHWVGKGTDNPLMLYIGVGTNPIRVLLPPAVYGSLGRPRQVLVTVAVQ